MARMEPKCSAKASESRALNKFIPIYRIHHTRSSASSKPEKRIQASSTITHTLEGQKLRFDSLFRIRLTVLISYYTLTVEVSSFFLITKGKPLLISLILD